MWAAQRVKIMPSGVVGVITHCDSDASFEDFYIGSDLLITTYDREKTNFGKKLHA